MIYAGLFLIAFGLVLLVRYKRSKGTTDTSESEKEELQKWLDDHYTELRDNVELREAHQSALIKVAIRLALTGVACLVLAIAPSLIPDVSTRTAMTDLIESMEQISLILGLSVGLLYGVNSITAFIKAFGNSPLDKVYEGRGLIPVEVLRKLREECEQRQTSE